MTDDELLKAIEAIVIQALETHGLKRVADRKRSLNAERQRRYRERNAASNAKVTRPRAKRNAGSNVTVTQTPTNATWEAYADAYKRRYGVEPVRNASVNGQLAGFVGRLGAEEAPQVAAFYVSLNRGLYLSARHAVPLMVKHAEALRTEWVTGQSMTDTQARMADRTQTNANVWGKLIQEAEDEGKQNPH